MIVVTKSIFYSHTAFGYDIDKTITKVCIFGLCIYNKIIFHNLN
jgi:hypothetical protein